MDTESKVSDREVNGDYPPISDQFNVSTGWICPLCGRVYSPKVKSCNTCTADGDSLGRKLLNE